MNPSSQSHIFWGDHAPLVALSGGALLVMASVRTAFALTAAAALLWVYGLTALVFFTASRILPSRGRSFILVFLAAFFGGIFLLFLWFLNPLLALELGFLVSLCPVCCIASGVFDRLESSPLADALGRVLTEAAILGLLALALALIREPLGFASLSLPGGDGGIVEIAGGGEDGDFLPIHIASSSAGGLLLLGLGVAIFRSFKDRYSGGDPS